VREWKINLIEHTNPHWVDRYLTLSGVAPVALLVPGRSLGPRNKSEDDVEGEARGVSCFAVLSLSPMRCSSPPSVYGPSRIEALIAILSTRPYQTHAIAPTTGVTQREPALALVASVPRTQRAPRSTVEMCIDLTDAHWVDLFPTLPGVAPVPQLVPGRTLGPRDKPEDDR
jgi:hypothetical protein